MGTSVTSVPVQPADSSMSLEEVRGKAYPEPGEDGRVIVSYVKQLWRDSEPDALVRFKQATYHLLFIDGRQWIDWNQRHKQWRDAPNVDGRVRATMNYIMPIIRARMQRMISGDLNWSVRPKTNAFADRDRAQVAEMLLPAHWDATDMDSKLRMALFLSFGTGISFLKQFWNQRIGPPTPATMILPDPETGQPIEAYVDENGQPLAPKAPGIEPPEGTFFYRPGDVDTSVRTVFNIRVNDDATGWTSADGLRWVIDAEVVPVSVIKEKYGDAARDVQATDGLESMLQYERIIRAVANRPGLATLGGDMYGAGITKNTPDKDLTLLLEYWELPAEQMPEGRLIVIGGETLLYDGPLPQGFVPYIPIFDERRPLDPWGRSSVKDLIPPQKIINQEWSLIIEELQRHGVGQWAAFDLPGVPDQLTNEHGAIIKVPFRAALQTRRVADVISRMPSPNPPRDRYELIREAKATMFDIGAFHEISRGSVPPGVDSGIAVQLLQEAEVMQMADVVAQLKQSLVQWGRQHLAIAKWGYGDDEERWLPISRPDLDFWMDSIRGGNLPSADQIDVDLKGFRPQSKAALRAEVKELMAQQLLDPRQGMQLMDLGRGIEGAFESENRQYSRARRENLALEEGRFVVVPSEQEGMPPTLVHPEDGMPFHLPTFDDPIVHLEVLKEIILDDTKPPQVRQAAMAHAAEHQLVQQAMVQATITAEDEQAKRQAATKQQGASS